MGFVRALFKLDLFYKTQVISSISGGSWFCGSFLLEDSFINENKITPEILLGNSYPIDKLKTATLESLASFNLNNQKEYLGKRITEAFVINEFKKGYDLGILSNELWNYTIGNIFLEPYGTNNKPISLNKEDALKIKEITNKIPAILKKKYPFWIGGATLLTGSKNNLQNINRLEFTPIYSGICPKVDTDTKLKYIGGVLQSTYSFGSIYPKILDFKKKSESEIVTVKIPNDIFKTQQIIGTSSSAYANYCYILNSLNITSNNIQPSLIDIIPKYNTWTPSIPNQTEEFYYGDGYILNNTGIDSLVRRNIKKIISFIPCSTIIDVSNNYNDTWESTELPSLFGVDKNIIKNNKVYNSNKLQIFEKKEWFNVSNQLIHNYNKGGPMYSINKLKVLPNTEFYIKGNYEVELFIIITQPSSNFNNLLPKSITDTFSDLKGPFPNFPCYPTLLINFLEIIRLTNSQINLLSCYTEWSIMNTELKDLIYNFYN